MKAARKNKNFNRKEFKLHTILVVMAIETQQIMSQLQTIKVELDYIKENMVDKDMFLDLEERQLLEESYEHEQQGKIISSENLKKELGL